MTKTYSDQIREHLLHLQSHGLAVTDLVIDTPQWIRCHAIGKAGGRGELAYITNSEKLGNGLLGLRTSFRGPKGTGSFRTYGLWPDDHDESLHLPAAREQEKTTGENQELAARKAYGFWEHSSISGRSDYLDRKGVGHHGIRFRSDEKYGNVAVVPMFDEHGRLWSYQLLNPDGTKRHPKDSRTAGLFHKLKEPVDGDPIGVAESYVTAATCLDLIQFPTACAFSSENLVAVSGIILHLFPASLIILFADNDRHLAETGQPNKGIERAREAKRLDEGRIILAVPDFGELPASKEASDWNDLVRVKGKAEATGQISLILKKHE